MDNSTVNFDEFDSPLEPITLYSFAVFLTLIGIMCFFSNSYLVYIFIRFKELHTPLNVLIVAITLSNLSGSIQFPFIIYSNYNHRFISHDFFLFILRIFLILILILIEDGHFQCLLVVWLVS